MFLEINVIITAPNLEFGFKGWAASISLVLILIPRLNEFSLPTMYFEIPYDIL